MFWIALKDTTLKIVILIIDYINIYVSYLDGQKKMPCFIMNL